MKIGLLTGGGDVPGLNSALKGVTLGALAEGWEVFGFRNGWQGPLWIEPDHLLSREKWLLPLTENTVRTIDRFGGTFLHSSRTNPGAVSRKDLPPHLMNKYPENAEKVDCTPDVLQQLAALKMDAIVAIGGDDTLSYAERLHREGFPVVGIPKTMDNDVFGTDYCLGFATAVRRTVEYLHQLRTCTGSHERFAVVEVMGRNAGYTSLIPAYLAGIDRCLIAEVPFDVNRLGELLMKDREKNPSHYAMLTVSEGATLLGESIVESGEADAYGHKKLGGIGQILGEKLKERTKVGIIYQNLGYLVRSGAPDPLDVMVTFNFANLAVELLKKRQWGRLVCLKGGRYSHEPLTILSQGLRRVPVKDYYDTEAYKPYLRSVLDMPMYMG